MSDTDRRVAQLERLRRSYTRVIIWCTALGSLAMVLTLKRIVRGPITSVHIIDIVTFGGGFAGAALYSYFARRRTIRRIDRELQQSIDSSEDDTP